MDGTQLHQQNTGINHFNNSVSTHPSIDSTIQEDFWKGVVEGCISDTFWVCVNEEIEFSLILTSNCDFFLTDYQNNEKIYGGYSITDEINKGRMSTIVFYIDGETIGEALVAWPLEGDLCLIINGVVLKRKGNIK
jgi:hypothetical protein